MLGRQAGTHQSVLLDSPPPVTLRLLLFYLSRSVSRGHSEALLLEIEVAGL